jgi:hypothetical protein
MWVLLGKLKFLRKRARLRQGYAATGPPSLGSFHRRSAAMADKTSRYGILERGSGTAKSARQSHKEDETSNHNRPSARDAVRLASYKRMPNENQFYPEKNKSPHLHEIIKFLNKSVLV